MHLHLTAQCNSPTYHQVEQRKHRSFPLLCRPSRELSAYNWKNIEIQSPNLFLPCLEIIDCN